MVFYGILGACFLPLLGQFGRFEIGGGGVLLLDFWLPFLFCIWCFSLWKRGESVIEHIKKYPLWIPSFFLLLIFWSSLFYNALWIDSFRSFLEGAFYAVRYSCLLLFGLIVFDEFSQGSTPSFLEKTPFVLAMLGSIFAVLGFFQLFLYPDFARMAEKGWDPHIGRLLSTWFDPNFMGSFFAYLLILLIAIVAMQWKKEVVHSSDIFSFFTKDKQRKWIVMSMLIMMGALLFTYSRSALLSFVIPFTILGVFYFRLLFIAGVIVVSLLLPFSDRALQRVSDGVSSAFSIADGKSMFVPDATARLRVENFQEGLLLANEHFVTGIGFNLIREYKTENIHSSGGFDSSLLTVFVTTGIFGLFFFLLLHFAVFHHLLPIALSSSDVVLRGLSVGILTNMVGIFAQSFFINSLFFSFFMLYFWGIIAFVLATNTIHKT